MRIIKGNKEEKLTINKSIFIANAFYVESKDDYQEALKIIKNKYKDATHNCFGVKISSQNIERYSDDNEPSGSAGKPIFKTIEEYGLDNILLVVSRYFGGKQLGFSGLVRAYKNASVKVIESNQIVTANIFYTCQIQINDLSITNNFFQIIKISDIILLSKNFHDFLIVEIALKNIDQLVFLEKFPKNSYRILQTREKILEL